MKDGSNGTPADSKTPFARFEDFTRKLLAVPKSEIAANEREYKRERKRAKKRKAAR